MVETAEGSLTKHVSAADALREQTLRLFTWILLGVATPLIAFVHIVEASAGRYSPTLAVQAVFHLAMTAVFVLPRSARLRAAAMLVYMFVTTQLIFFHDGPTLTVGLVFFAGLLLAPARQIAGALLGPGGRISGQVQAIAEKEEGSEG